MLKSSRWQGAPHARPPHRTWTTAPGAVLGLTLRGTAGHTACVPVAVATGTATGMGTSRRAAESGAAGVGSPAALKEV